MKRALLFFLFIPLLIPVVAQTGPGGVGSSTNNKIWLDPLSGIGLVGGGLDTWSDRSGSGNNATAAAANARPSNVSSNVNGVPSFDFDGVNDEMRITDNNGLDFTAWHFFIVVSVDQAKDYNAWLTKGNDGSENFEILSYATNNIHNPILYTSGTRTFPSSANNQVNTGNVFNIIEYSFSSSVGRRTYNNFSNILTDVENSTPSNNNFDVYIGNEKNTSGRFLDGDIAEVIAYNAVLNTAQRTIVNNYLSSKYNITLSSGDNYAGDTGANGDFDQYVSGIGQSSAGNTNTSFSSSVAGGLDITYVSGFNDGDYIMAGYNSTGNWQSFSDVGGMTGTNNARWKRIWYVDVTNTGTNMVANITFDMSDGGVGVVTPATNTNYVLLYRAGQTGNWTELTTASGISGDRISFNNITLTNDGYYTIGTKNAAVSVLPVELISFTASANPDHSVGLNWMTSTEINNEYFTIQKSRDGIVFSEVENIPSKAPNGNSNALISYTTTDYYPYDGISYYRLKQTDNNGHSGYYNIVTVDLEKSGKIEFTVYPNPNKGEFTVDFSGIENNHEVQVLLHDYMGKEVYTGSFITTQQNSITIVPADRIANGTYFCSLVAEGIRYTVKVIVN